MIANTYPACCVSRVCPRFLLISFFACATHKCCSELHNGVDQKLEDWAKMRDQHLKNFHCDCCGVMHKNASKRLLNCPGCDRYLCYDTGIWNKAFLLGLRNHSNPVGFCANLAWAHGPDCTVSERVSE
jgi:hypothetical protein